MLQPASHSFRRLSLLACVSGVFLSVIVNVETQAQEVDETCPCFSVEEVEAIFTRGMELGVDEGMFECGAEDYTAEFSAEVTISDQDFNVVAHASVNWFDYDPGGCEYMDEYMDTHDDPGVERDIAWPHPAPEATARACYRIIANVIRKSDKSGSCNTYP